MIRWLLAPAEDVALEPAIYPALVFDGSFANAREALATFWSWVEVQLRTG